MDGWNTGYIVFIRYVWKGGKEKYWCLLICSTQRKKRRARSITKKKIDSCDPEKTQPSTDETSLFIMQRLISQEIFRIDAELIKDVYCKAWSPLGKRKETKLLLPRSEKVENSQSEVKKEKRHEDCHSITHHNAPCKIKKKRLLLPCLHFIN